MDRGRHRLHHQIRYYHTEGMRCADAKDLAGTEEKGVSEQSLYSFMSELLNSIIILVLPSFVIGLHDCVLYTYILYSGDNIWVPPT